MWLVYQDEPTTRLHPIPFTTVQMLVIVVVCLPPTAVQGIGHLSALAALRRRVHRRGVLGRRAVAPGLGQRRLGPSRTALILILEPVFAGLAGYVNGERLGATPPRRRGA